MSFFEKYRDVLDVVMEALGLVAGLLTVAIHASRLMDIVEEHYANRLAADESDDYAD